MKSRKIKEVVVEDLSLNRVVNYKNYLFFSFFSFFLLTPSNNELAFDESPEGFFDGFIINWTFTVCIV